MAQIPPVRVKKLYSKWLAVVEKRKDIAYNQFMYYATIEAPVTISHEDAEKIYNFFEQYVPPNPCEELSPELLQELLTYLEQE